MKKVFKKEVIISFIIGLIIASSITVYAYSNFANQVGYTTNKNANIINVEQALNDLYSKTNINTIYFLVWSGVDNGFYYSNYQDYKYFKISQTDSGTSTSLTLTKYNWSNNGATESLSLDTKYEITTNNEQVVITPNSGYRNIKIEFFKE